MNLSNQLTFSLVFSVLLVAGFALVPSVMAAEGGPTATITIDDSSISAVGDVAAIPTVDGTNVLLTSMDRMGLATATDDMGLGYFRVKVVFSEPVFPNNEQTDVATAVVAIGDLGREADDMELYCWECWSWNTD